MPDSEPTSEKASRGDSCRWQIFPNLEQVFDCFTMVSSCIFYFIAQVSLEFYWEYEVDTIPFLYIKHFFSSICAFFASIVLNYLSLSLQFVFHWDIPNIDLFNFAYGWMEDLCFPFILEQRWISGPGSPYSSPGSSHHRLQGEWTCLFPVNV